MAKALFDYQRDSDSLFVGHFLFARSAELPGKKLGSYPVQLVSPMPSVQRCFMRATRSAVHAKVKASCPHGYRECEEPSGDEETVGENL